MLLPRPEQKVRPNLLPIYENRGWILQNKKNGEFSVITNDAAGPRAINRHGNPHPFWKWSAETKAFFHGRPDMTICAELLNTKTKGGPKDVHFIHDIISFEGKSLLGTTYAERYALLEKIFGGSVQNETPEYAVLSDRFWLARNRTKNFLEIFRGLKEKEDEGVVVKDPNAKWFGKNDWAVKCRAKTKNYSF